MGLLTSAATRPALVAGLFLLAALLRLYPLLTSTYIWDEEREWIVVAERISLRPGGLYLPLHDGHHGSLPAYFIRAGAELFGRTPLGYRFFNLAAGLATLFVVWRLAQRWAGPSRALWPLFLLAANEYHIGISFLAVEKSLQHFFIALSLYGFYRYLAGEGAKFLYLSAATAGLAFLCNERSVLIGLAYGISLVWLEGWSWLRRKEIYFALAIFLLTTAPDVYANLRLAGAGLGVSFAEHLSRFGGVGFNRHYLLFFGRDAVGWAYDLLGRTLHDQAPEYAAMNPLFGALLLGVAGWSWRCVRCLDGGGKLFLSVFTVVLLFFSVVRPGSVPPGLDPVAWFWVDLTLPAAALLSALVLSSQRRVLSRVGMVIAGLGFLWAASSVFSGRIGPDRIVAAAAPEVLWPADGRLHEVRIFFQVCAICEPVRTVQLVQVRVDGGAGSADVEGADLGTDDRTFFVRAAPPGGPPRVYTVVYRITDSLGREREVRAEILAPVRFDRPWPARFWTRSVDP